MESYCWGVIRGTSINNWQDTMFLIGTEKNIQHEMSKYIGMRSESGQAKGEICFSGFSSLEDAKKDFFGSAYALYNNFDYSCMYLSESREKNVY